MEQAGSGRSADELREAMRAAEEAMLDLGPTMAALEKAGASEAEKTAFQHVYGEALCRRGKLKQELIAAGIDPDTRPLPEALRTIVDDTAHEDQLLPSASYPPAKRARGIGSFLRWL